MSEQHPPSDHAGVFSGRQGMALRIVLALAAAAAVYLGWRAFWFLTDDAFILFRYVSNHRLGWGFTWNPPPFAPVEGYTSFLWVVILRLAWAVTGQAPPETANVLSLLFGYGALGLVGLFAARMQLPASWSRYRLLLWVLALAGIVTNRTFLTWLNSGLETALFNFLFIWWIYEGLTPPARRSRCWLLRLSLSATLCSLTRPDGLLILLATLLLLFFREAARPADQAKKVRQVRWQELLMVAPLLVKPAHLLWRKLYYGYWLPNTFYAKVSAPWPEAGMRYAASFVLEYGLWIWLLIVLAAGVVALRRWAARGRIEAENHVSAIIVVGAVLAHFAYYTFLIGGDHFEYRVYSHLAPLLWLSAVWLLGRVTERLPVAAAALIVFLLASLPIQWVHWRETRHLDTRRETFKLVQPIAEHFPPPARSVVKAWDRWQKWLITHAVCRRHQGHKKYVEYQMVRYPSRAEGSRIKWEQRGVIAKKCVGYLGWVLPEVAVIDKLGLSDRVIAHSPMAERKIRRMAHGRCAPKGYVQCFRPNVTVHNRVDKHGNAIDLGGRDSIVVTPRGRPLTDGQIRACERREWGDDCVPGFRERRRLMRERKRNEE